MTNSRRMEVMTHIRQMVGDADHFKEGGSKDTARQIGIWYMVRKYLELKGKNVHRVNEKIIALLDKYPDLRDLFIRYGEYAEQEYLHTREADDFSDGHGATYLDWSLKSFGERLYVYDS